MGTEHIHALRSVSIDIKRGEYVAFMGPSGSGKSTLMNIIGCLDTPSKGQYVLNGQDVSRMSDNELAEVRNKEIGFVFQTFQPAAAFHLARKRGPTPHLRRPGQARAHRARPRSPALGGPGRPRRPPPQRAERRPAPARGHCPRPRQHTPSVLLADEPTGALDSKTSYEIMGLFEALYAKGNTIIMVTHEEDIARYAHRIVRLRDGLVSKPTK